MGGCNQLTAYSSQLTYNSVSYSKSHSLYGKNFATSFPAVNANEKSIPTPETLSIHTSNTNYATKHGGRIESGIFDSAGTNESAPKLLRFHGRD